MDAGERKIIIIKMNKKEEHGMKESIRNHEMFTIIDYRNLLNIGCSDAEIIILWDIELKESKESK